MKHTKKCGCKITTDKNGFVIESSCKQFKINDKFKTNKNDCKCNIANNVSNRTNMSDIKH